ncbi:MAG: hypothetical protein HSCHL_2059 [Hydrogenibacillus schlegelii]|uniref:Uncharacterized protein n=1 Tax=Hydrogenibacillus schlegelii TaxID=1484 RepID=A0A2T5GB75_HYDSH|nr:MAG: hypothetical protein HSCHL_2059 [Hydrogenibacillus schlegelii]
MKTGDTAGWEAIVAIDRRNRRLKSPEDVSRSIENLLKYGREPNGHERKDGR